MMRTVRNILFLLLTTGWMSAMAQQDVYTWRLGVKGGLLAQGNSISYPNSFASYFYGIQVQPRLSASFSLRMDLTRAYMRFRTLQHDSRLLLSTVYTLDNNLIIRERAKVAPYIALGGGYAAYTSTYTEADLRNTDWVAAGELGLKFRLSDRFNLNLFSSLQYALNAANFRTFGAGGMVQHFGLSFHVNFRLRRSKFKAPTYFIGKDHEVFNPLPEPRSLLVVVEDDEIVLEDSVLSAMAAFSVPQESDTVPVPATMAISSADSSLAKSGRSVGDGSVLGVDSVMARADSVQLPDVVAVPDSLMPVADDSLVLVMIPTDSLRTGRDSLGTDMVETDAPAVYSVAADATDPVMGTIAAPVMVDSVSVPAIAVVGGDTIVRPVRSQTGTAPAQLRPSASETSVRSQAADVQQSASARTSSESTSGSSPSGQARPQEAQQPLQQPAQGYPQYAPQPIYIVQPAAGTQPAQTAAPASTAVPEQRPAAAPAQVNVDVRYPETTPAPVVAPTVATQIRPSTSAQDVRPSTVQDSLLLEMVRTLQEIKQSLSAAEKRAETAPRTDRAVDRVSSVPSTNADATNQLLITELVKAYEESNRILKERVKQLEDGQSKPEPMKKVEETEVKVTVQTPEPQKKPTAVDEKRIISSNESHGIVLQKYMDVRFPVNRWSITTDQKQILAELANKIKQNPDLAVVITGFADNLGDDTYNIQLSRYRAEAVMQYLRSRGVDESNIFIKYHGKKFATGPSNEDDRRVEVEIISKN